MLTISAYDRHVEQLFDVLTRLAKVFSQADIEYRVVGGVAVFLYVHERDPLAARATRDIDLAVDRADLPRIAEAARPAGFEYRHAAGVDLLVDTREPGRRGAAHFAFVREKVRQDYAEAVPEFSAPVRTQVLLAPARDLIRMKLTSFRLKDRVHLQDMDAVGLITPDIEAELPELLRARLKEVRAAE